MDWPTATPVTTRVAEVAPAATATVTVADGGDDGGEVTACRTLMLLIVTVIELPVGAGPVKVIVNVEVVPT